MKLYEYKCPNCGLITTHRTHDAQLFCGCGEKGDTCFLMKRVYSIGGISFKGSGFARNDLKKKD